MKIDLEEILQEFGFQCRKITSLDKYYVHLRIKDENWILKSNKDEYVSKYNDVRDRLTRDTNITAVWKTAIDGGGHYFEEGEQLKFRSGNLYITKPLHKN
jgi:hypothetical protein